MEKEGWVFNWNDQYVISPDSTYCQNVPSTSYCGFRYPGDGMISYTFSYSGTATLEYGQSWDTGSVHIMKNDEEIDSRINRGSSSTTFDFSSGDVLQIKELGNSVINIDKLSLRKLGKKELYHTFIYICLQLFVLYVILIFFNYFILHHFSKLPSSPEEKICSREFR